MKPTKLVFIAVVQFAAIAALLFFTRMPFAQEMKSAAMLPGQDRVAIQDLIYQYSYSYDAKDATAFLDLFTADCLFEAYASDGAKVMFKFAGREQLTKAVTTRMADYKQKDLQTRHFQTNTILTKVGEGKVEAITMYVVMLQSPNADAPQPHEMGYYKDTIVKTDMGWKFAKRTALLTHK